MKSVLGGSDRFRLAGGLVIALVLLAIGLILWQQRVSQQDERARVISDTERRAVQLAGAVAGRMSAFVRNVDFVLQQVRRDYGVNDARFRAQSDFLLASFPEQSMLQLSFADADGNVTYSNLGLTGKVNIGDREHFKVHTDGGDRLFISKPLMGRISKAWTIQFSRPVRNGERFAGVAVLSLSPAYVSQVLATLELDPEDAIALFQDDGTYLARNRGIDNLLGKTLTPARPFMLPGAAARGSFRNSAFADGAERYFGWQRVPDTRLVVNVGLDVRTVLLPLETRFRQEWTNAGIVSAALLALAIAVLVLLHNLSRRQEDIARSEARFRSLVALTSDGYWEQDEHYRYTALEGDLYVRNGLGHIDHIGKTRWDPPTLNMSDADWAKHKAMLQAHLPFRDLELHRAEVNGSSPWVSVSGEPVFDAQGLFRGYRGIARDTTERIQAEEARGTLEAQLRQAQKMESLGTLAGGIAHDFNNILAAILGNAELARLDTAPNHPARESLAEIEKASRRARDLVKQILAFSRQQPRELRILDLREVGEDAVKLLRASLPAGIELATRFEANLANVEADPTQIHQVMMNLGTNAYHALGERSGRIEFSLDESVVDEGAIRIDLPKGRYVRLSVIDSGSGMDAATMERIFDPFFTTKAPGEGTGLGLSVVSGIMKGHGGAISVESQPGKGSRFHLYFPAVMDEVGLALEALPLAVHGGGQRILFLDDEVALAALATRFLARQGYQVKSYTRAAEAIAAFRADPMAFDLLITDFNMPDRSGLEVAEEVLRLRPGFPVLLASGYVTDELREKARTLGIREVVYKPIGMGDLAAAIQRIQAV